MKKYRLQDYTDLDFPLFIARQDYRRRKEAYHGHDCNEIVYILSGSGVNMVNEQHFPIIKGDLYIMNRKDAHAFETENGLSFFNLIFNDSFFSVTELAELQSLPLYERFFDASGNGSPKKYFLMPPNSEKAEQLLGRIEKELREKRPGYRIAARSAFLDFMIFLLRGVAAGLNCPPIIHDNAVDSISRVIGCIHSHYREKLTLARLARTGGVSANYLGELFKRETGLSVFEYIGKLRVDKARETIDGSSQSLSEIAADLGFYDSSYFCRSFRKYTGLSPREYEKLVRG